MNFELSDFLLSEKDFDVADIILLGRRDREQSYKAGAKDFENDTILDVDSFNEMFGLQFRKEYNMPEKDFMMIRLNLYEEYIKGANDGHNYFFNSNIEITPELKTALNRALNELNGKDV
ncbi:hypothetical protein FACS1894191_4370 [Clostridia bacterium]|nr:hypothetical protein FACS1894191_4370 [Clostridia bacterium]